MAVLPEGEMSPQMRQMMRALKQDSSPAGPVVLEINPTHALVKGLANLRKTNADMAGLLASQLLDNALLSAGLLDHPQEMVARITQIMEKAAGI
jgi:molecular chaperone HtpG